MKRFLVFVSVIFTLVLASCGSEGPYSVIYHANAKDAIGFVTDPKEYMTGDEAIVLETNFTREGYTFTHWNTTPSDSGKKYNPGEKIKITNMTVSLYAQWEAE